MVDPVMHFIQIPIPASGLHGYHGLKIPIVLAGKSETLPVGDGPEDGRVDSTAEVRMKFGTWGLGWLRHTRFYFSVVGRWGSNKPPKKLKPSFPDGPEARALIRS